MIEIHFNRIYIIESLKPGEELTGTNLYNDLLRYQSIKHPDFEAILKSPKDRNEWKQVFNEIYAGCTTNRNAPILHFEVHGSVAKDGLVLTSRELVSWEELYADLAKINIAIKNELFITMAVCHGAYLYKAIKFSEPVAFRGFIGSFEAIQVDDLAIRYEGFYEELFNSLDINKAYDRLLKANPTLPNSYKCYSAEYIFAKAFSDQVEKCCSNKDMKHLETGNLVDNKKANMEMVKKKLNKYFTKWYNSFFMIDKYPELANSISYSNNFKEMIAWYHSFH